jgi:hypothetical protein
LPDLTSDLTRFWAKVEKTETCWLWTGAKISRGYGCCGFEGQPWLVHRLAYTVLVGPIGQGLTIDHVKPRCTSKLCVRPDHLEPVTRRENTQRYARLITTCKRGHELRKRPGDRQRRCRACQAIDQREARAAGVKCAPSVPS